MAKPEVQGSRSELERERDEAIRERDIMRKANVTPEDAERPWGQSVAYWQDRALDYATHGDRWRERAIYAEAAADPEQKALRALITSMMWQHQPRPGSYENEYSDGWQAVLDQIENWLDARSPKAEEAQMSQDEQWPKGTMKPNPEDVVAVLMTESMARLFEERCLGRGNTVGATHLSGPLLFSEDDLPTYIIGVDL